MLETIFSGLVLFRSRKSEATGERTVEWVCFYQPASTTVKQLSTFKVSCESKAKTVRNAQQMSRVTVQRTTWTLSALRRQRQLDIECEFKASLVTVSSRSIGAT